MTKHVSSPTRERERETPSVDGRERERERVCGFFFAGRFLHLFSSECDGKPPIFLVLLLVVVDGG